MGQAECIDAEDRTGRAQGPHLPAMLHAPLLVVAPWSAGRTSGRGMSDLPSVTATDSRRRTASAIGPEGVARRARPGTNSPNGRPQKKPGGRRKPPYVPLMSLNVRIVVPP